MGIMRDSRGPGPRTTGATRKVALAMLAMASGIGVVALSGTGAAAWCDGYGCGGPPPAAGIVGGLALGALAGAAAAGALAPPPPPVVVYDDGPECYITSRRVWVEGRGWRRRNVEVCD